MAIFGEGRRSIATIWMEDAQLQVLIDGEIWETHPDVHVLNSFVANQFLILELHSTSGFSTANVSFFTVESLLH